MPRVHWHEKLSETYLYSDEGYGTGSQDSFIVHDQPSPTSPTPGNATSEENAVLVQKGWDKA